MNTNRIAQSATASMTRLLRPRRNRAAAVGVVAMLAVGVALGAGGQAAYADNYPSWGQVQQALANVAAKKALITQLSGQISALQGQVADTQKVAEQKGQEAYDAQVKYEDAANKAATLKSQADAAEQQAEKSKLQAGQLAAQLSRTSGGDLSTRIFFSGKKADDLLSQLGMATMVKDQSAGVYQKAVQDQNNAKSLTSTANAARDALKTLDDAAQQALKDATAANDAANKALAAQQANQATLQAQLATLQTGTNQLVADYQKGLAAQYGPGASIGAGAVSSDGYARPAGGHISSPYGMRLDPYYHTYQLHDGTDLGAGCGTPIYAAHSGTVIYAGPFGGYGNYVKISDGDGYSTAYGHIVNGGILVQVGQGVGVGQNIARVGSTGASTGCHLHFSVFQGSGTIDPVPFMRAHGVELAN